MTVSNASTAPNAGAKKTKTNTTRLQALLNRTAYLSETDWKEMGQRWSYDLFAKTPAPALLQGTDGKFQATDLDLACFLAALAQRGAVVQFPHYKGMRKNGQKGSQVVMATENRRGRITGLQANKDVFSFGLQIEDVSILDTKTGTLGAPRLFKIIGLDGNWYPGWDQIDFLPTEKENKFIEDFFLATGDSLVFDNFVNPNTWASFYSRDFFELKVAIQRAEEEGAYIFQELKRLSILGLAPPKEPKEKAAHYRGKTEKEDPRPTKTVEVRAFESEVDAAPVGCFSSLDNTAKAYIEGQTRRNFLIYKLLPELRFHARSREFAFWSFFQRQQKQTRLDFAPIPSSVGAKWETDYQEPGKRTKWNRLNHQQEGAIRYRTWLVQEEVTLG